MRIVRGNFFRFRYVDFRKSAHSFDGCFLFTHTMSEDLCDLISHLHNRIECRNRMLHYHCYLSAPDLFTHLFGRDLHEILPHKHYLSTLHSSRVTHQVKDRRSGNTFSTTGLPNQTEELALAYMKINPIYSLDHTSVCIKVYIQVFNIQ